MAIEIVDLPSYKMVIFHSYVSLPEGKWESPDKGHSRHGNSCTTRKADAGSQASHLGNQIIPHK